MKTTKLTLALTATLSFCLAAASHAAQITFRGTPPTPGPNDIANLAGANAELNNVGEGDHNATYLAFDRPVQGQTFTTGTNSAGYQLVAITIREVTHETYAFVPDMSYTLRITRKSDNALEVIAVEEAAVKKTLAGNIPSSAEGLEQGTGSGGFVTITLSKTVLLKPNTIYGFDVGAGGKRHYWQLDGTATNAYAGGQAYSSGSAGVGSSSQTLRNGDRVFVVALSPVRAPTSNQAQAAPERQSPDR